MSNNNFEVARICPICRKVILNAAYNQKYHQDGCNETAKEISKLKSLINCKLDNILSV